MSFASVLDAYCKALGCTNKQIAEKCSISPSALSRYRNGSRTPDIDSAAVDRLVKGIVALAQERSDVERWQEDAIRNTIEGSLSGSKMLGMSFGARFNSLMALLDVRNTEMARHIDVSPSYISRIRGGQRMPADQRRFARKASRLFAQRCLERGKISDLISLTDSTGNISNRSHLDLDNTSDVSETIEHWLLGSNIIESDLAAVDDLLERLNDFYFNRELERIKELVPIKSTGEKPEIFSRFYYGLEEMKEAELTFFEIAATHSTKTIRLSSDMPLLETSLDSSFIHNYRLQIGSLIHHGTHIDVIHSVERPLSETVVSLKLWLPLYLTGLVTSYYLKGINNGLFHHVNYTSDHCSLAAEAVHGHGADGRYYLSTHPEDVSYYQRKMDFIMEHVSPMLQICHDADPEWHQLLEDFKKNEQTVRGHSVRLGRYKNLQIISYPGNSAIVTILCDPVIHLVIRHPKLRYVISHMR